MNIVNARIHYKSGVYTAKAVAPEHLVVGDVANVRVKSGYETTCRIIEILDEGVPPNNKHAQILEEELDIMYGSKTVIVKHISSDRKGVYYTDLDLKNGDLVVYDSGDHTYLHVGTVINNDPEELSAKSWVVDTVDIARHNERVENDKKARKLLAKLNARKKQLQDIEILRLIANNDPETKALLDEYTALTSSGGAKE